jgi:hypothetical protein
MYEILTWVTAALIVCLTHLPELLIAAAIVYTGRLISKDLKNLRRSLSNGAETISHSVQAQTEAIVESVPDEDEDEEESILPENS